MRSQHEIQERIDSLIVIHAAHRLHRLEAMDHNLWSNAKQAHSYMVETERAITELKWILEPVAAELEPVLV